MIAIIGASGQLGSAFCAMLGAEAQPLARADIDLEDFGAIAGAIEGTDAGTIINCAGYTDVDEAEDDGLRAKAVNASAVGELARACREQGKGFVTFSTDYVFDGTKDSPYVESDVPRPLSVYGLTKLDGERLAMSNHPGALVVRTSWLLSGTHVNFAATMLRLVGAGSITVVDDQIGHPTMVDDLAPAVATCVERGVSGVLHLANQGTVSWFQLARECAEIAGLDPSGISACATDDFPRRARRPRNSVLESERVTDLGLGGLPHYRPGLERAIAQLLAAAPAS